jgi:hypothetical protein
MLAPLAAGWFDGPAGAWGPVEIIRDMARLPRVVKVQRR